MLGIAGFKPLPPGSAAYLGRVGYRDDARGLENLALSNGSASVGELQYSRHNWLQSPRNQYNFAKMDTRGALSVMLACVRKYLDQHRLVDHPFADDGGHVAATAHNDVFEGGVDRVQDITRFARLFEPQQHVANFQQRTR